MHLEITTQEDPHLPLARLRARDQLTELHAADLRFTPTEASAFHNQMKNFNLSVENIAALETRTEGWIAVLQLASLAMQGCEDVAGFMQAFSGSYPLSVTTNKDSSTRSIDNICIQVPDRNEAVKKCAKPGLCLVKGLEKMEKQDLEFLARQGNDARRASLGSNKVTFLLSAEETGGVFSLTEFEAAPPPAPSAPLHIHWDANETIYVLEGEFQIMFEDRSTAVQPGASIFVPKGTRHTIANAGTKRGRLLVVLTPPGFEGYWKEMSQLMEKSGGAVDPEIALATQKKYHVDMLGQARNFEERSGKSHQP